MSLCDAIDGRLEFLVIPPVIERKLSMETEDALQALGINQPGLSHLDVNMPLNVTPRRGARTVSHSRSTVMNRYL